MLGDGLDTLSAYANVAPVARSFRPVTPPLGLGPTDVTMRFAAPKHRRESGLMLLELLAYMSLLAIVLALTAVVFNTALTQAAHLRRNIADIERAAKAGERWRADVRSATGPIQIESRDGATAFEIPQSSGKVVYFILPKAIHRRSAERDTPEVFLTGVNSAQMAVDRRAHATGYRWELELERRQKNARLRPLFTFIAVPAKP